MSSGTGCSGTVARTVAWTSFNMAASLTEGTSTEALTYDSEHGRITEVATGANAGTTTYLNDPTSGAMEETFLAGTTLTHVASPCGMMVVRTGTRNKEAIMEQDEYAGFSNDLDRLAQRIGMRMTELKTSGRFAEDFEGSANAILARQEQLRDRAAQAARSGTAWETMKAELERDYSSLFDNALSFEQRIDEDFAKSQE